MKKEDRNYLETTNNKIKTLLSLEKIRNDDGTVILELDNPYILTKDVFNTLDVITSKEYFKNRNFQTVCDNFLSLMFETRQHFYQKFPIKVVDELSKEYDRVIDYVMCIIKPTEAFDIVEKKTDKRYFLTTNGVWLLENTQQIANFKKDIEEKFQCDYDSLDDFEYIVYDDEDKKLKKQLYTKLCDMLEIALHPLFKIVNPSYDRIEYTNVFFKEKETTKSVVISVPIIDLLKLYDNSVILYIPKGSKINDKILATPMKITKDNIYRNETQKLDLLNDELEMVEYKELLLINGIKETFKFPPFIKDDTSFNIIKSIKVISNDGSKIKILNKNKH